jgi:hypothetical protein
MIRILLMAGICLWTVSGWAQEPAVPAPAGEEQPIPAAPQADEVGTADEAKAEADAQAKETVFVAHVPYVANYGANYYYPYYAYYPAYYPAAYTPGYIYPAYNYTPISPIAYPVYGYYPYYYGGYYASPWYGVGYGYGYVPYATYGGYYNWYNPYYGAGWYTGYGWPVYMGW